MDIVVALRASGSPEHVVLPGAPGFDDMGINKTNAQVQRPCDSTSFSIEIIS